MEAGVLGDESATDGGLGMSEGQAQRPARASGCMPVDQQRGLQHMSPLRRFLCRAGS